MLTTILAAAVVLGVLILVHELGHFWAAKAVDIEVPRFSIGIGPKLAGIQWGETEYVISWLPLGGYVKMAGMGEEEALEGLEGEAEEGRASSDRDFESKPLWARFLAISAGVIMNFLFAVAAFAAIAGIWGVETPAEPVLADVQEEALGPGTSALATVPRGARVERVNGDRVDDFDDVMLKLGSLPSGEVTLGLAGGGSVRFTLPDADSARQRLMGALKPPSMGPAVIGEVMEGGPADSAGVEAGDRVTAVGGRPVDDWLAFVAGVEGRPAEPVPVTVERGGETRRLTVVPRTEALVVEGDTVARYGRVGVTASVPAMAAAARQGRRTVGVGGALGHGVATTWEWTARTLSFLGDIVGGGVDAGSVGGPVRIAEMSGDVARAGPLAFLNFMAILSVNLAILNLLPIPVLDGGHLMFLSVEAVRGRALSVEARIRLTQMGLLIVAALMIFLVGNDLIQVFGG